MHENSVKNAQTSCKTTSLMGLEAALGSAFLSAGALRFTNVTGFGPVFCEPKRSPPNEGTGVCIAAMRPSQARQIQIGKGV